MPHDLRGHRWVKTAEYVGFIKRMPDSAREAPTGCSETAGGGSSSTYPYIHITINTLQVELKNAWGATDLRNMKCVCSSAGITNTCHTTEESQAIVVTPPKVHLDSFGCITVSEWGGP